MLKVSLGKEQNCNLQKIGNNHSILDHTINGENMEKSRKYYKDLLQTKKDYLLTLKNFLQAFVAGGIVSIIGQLLFDFYHQILSVSKTDSGIYMTLSMVFIAGLLTGLGIYDNIGQVAKCGIAIPITGFSNAAVSAAMEYHKEGIVLGIGANALKLAGSVIVLGTCSAIVVASIRYLFEVVL